ncbi:IclR family transcriptional regulator [Parazoarcus communis]|uniref:IclR family transcriptional regulator n=1 Tax=Parazoarcus communis TaxID=41977 RepID=A0A2U8GLB5_9RHOO|nr:IclR family transcriptional regulator [Parazoarcus communis]AWI74238.1 IclR family transcriptional regulator [Parazoarcus communis]
MKEREDDDSGTRSTGTVIVKPVVNAIRILQHLTESGSPERSSDMARALSINPSTCFNILRTLASEEMVTFDPVSKTYTPGLGLARLVGHLVSQGQRLDVAQPLMQDFAARFHVTVTLWRQMSSERIVLVKSETSPTDLRIDMAIGQRLPILMGASGRLFAAHMKLDEDAMRTVFDRMRWARPLDFSEYCDQVQHAREHGWAMDDGYFSAGIMAIAAPIHDRYGELSFTISAVMFRGQYIGDEATKIGVEIRRLAEKLSNLLI